MMRSRWIFRNPPPSAGADVISELPESVTRKVGADEELPPPWQSERFPFQPCLPEDTWSGRRHQLQQQRSGMVWAGRMIESRC
jgi:hypothetical protein